MYICIWYVYIRMDVCVCMCVLQEIHNVGGVMYCTYCDFLRADRRTAHDNRCCPPPPPPPPPQRNFDAPVRKYSGCVHNMTHRIQV
jgi:hypothetical protein